MQTSNAHEIIRQHSQPMQPIATGLAPQLSPLNGIRAVLFDVYGTLFCSGTGDIGLTDANAPSDAMQAALALASPQGPCSMSADVLHSAFIELIHADHRAAHARGIAHPEVNIPDIWDRLLNATGRFRTATSPLTSAHLKNIALTFECIVNPVWPVPGLLDTLAALQPQNVHLGIVSNAQFYTRLLFEALLAASVDELGFEDDLCAWSYVVGEAKPSSRIFAGVLSALAERGISPEETVYMGNDMLNDIWTASQLGCKTILYAGDMRSLRLREGDVRCDDLRPDAIVTQLDQVPVLLCG